MGKTFQRTLSLILAVLTVVTMLPVMQLQTEAADLLPHPGYLGFAETEADVAKIVNDYYSVVTEGDKKNAFWNRGVRGELSSSVLKPLGDKYNKDYGVPRNSGSGAAVLKRLPYIEAVTNESCKATGKGSGHIFSDSKGMKSTCTSNFFRLDNTVQVDTGEQAQCEGFAEYMAYVVFGDRVNQYSEPIFGSKAKNVEIRPGDVLRITGSPGHSIFVYAVENGYAQTIECNLSSEGGYCKIYKRENDAKRKIEDLKTLVEESGGNHYICKAPVKQTSWDTNVEVKLKSSCNLYNGPMEASGIKSKTAFPKGTTGIATEIQKNDADNCWYQVTIGTETGWIYGGNCEVAGLAPDAITVSERTNLNGKEIKQNRTTLNLTEDLTAKNCVMTKITGAFYSIEDQQTPKQGVSVTGTFTSFDVQSGKDSLPYQSGAAADGTINWNLRPRLLALGVHKYTLAVDVKVKITDGKSVSDKAYTIKELMADWFEVREAENVLTVTLNPNGGSCVLAKRTVGKNKAIGELPPATRENTKFLGWYTDKEGGTPVTKDSKFSAATTLYAHWEDSKYTVTYDANGGSGAPKEQIKQKGKTLTLSKTVPTREGYTFNGWEGSDGKTYKAGSAYETDKALTLKAKWKANAYAIKFNKNKGSGTMDKIDTSYGKDVTLPAAEFTRDGYTFSGWNTKADGTGKRYGDKAAVKNLTAKDKGTVTLYAQWKVKTYDIRFHANTTDTVSDMPADAKKTHDEPLKLSKTEPRRTGYTFDEWLDGKDGYDAGDKYRENRNATLKASWEANEYKIAYDKNGGKGIMLKTNAAYGENVTLKENKFTRDGYTFSGWNTKANGSGTGYKNKAQVKNLTAKDGETVTLYAQWTKNAAAASSKTYKVTYDLNGGRGTFAEQTKKHDQPLKLHTGTPLKDGYTFAGWKVGSTSEILAAGGSYTGNAAVTLKATWNKASTVYDLSAAEYMKLCKSFFSAGTLEISVKGAWFKSLPCSRLKTCINSEDLYPSALPVGTKMTVTGLYQNSEAQYWYKATWDGQTGYISCDQATFTPAKANFAISGESRPTTLTSGSGFSLKGTVTSAVYPYRITGTISDHEGQRDTQTVTASAKTYNLNSAVYDNNISFGLLKIGDCNYTVTADVTIYYSSDGKTLLTDKQSKTLVDRDFEVVGAAHTMTFVSGDDQNKTIATLKVYDYHEFTTPYMTYDRDGYEFLGYTVKRLKDGKVFAGGWMTEAQASNSGKALKIYKEGSKWTLEDSWTAGNVKNSDYRFTGVWEKLPVYTVTYDANGGTGAPAAQSTSTDNHLYLSNTIPVRTGHTFLGWADSRTATVAEYARGELYTDRKDITLYAVWKADTYAVTYDANGGTGAPAAQTKVYGQTLILSDSEPIREDHTFLGWAVSKTATEAEYGKGGSYTKNQAVILYAVWRRDTSEAYLADNHSQTAWILKDGTAVAAENVDTSGLSRVTVTFCLSEKLLAKYPDAEDWAANNPVVVTEYNIPVAMKDLTLDFLVEDGSYDLEIQSRDSYVEHYTCPIRVSGDTEIQLDLYELILNFNGGRLQLNTTEAEQITSYYIYENYEAFACAFDRMPAREGFTLTGWDRDAKALRPEYELNFYEHLFFDRDLNFYAVWQENGEDNSIYVADNNTQTFWVIRDEEVARVEQVDTSKLNHVVLTLNPSDAIRQKYSDLSQLPEFQSGVDVEGEIHMDFVDQKLDFHVSDSELNYYFPNLGAHQFDIREDQQIVLDLCEVFLDFNGGQWKDGTEGNGMLYHAIAGKQRSYSSTRGPVREGYTLLGWSADPSAQQAVFRTKFAASFDTDTVLYAVWEKDDSEEVMYTITYHPNGGENGPEGDYANSKNPCRITSQVPFREGYAFLGWAEDPNAEAPEYYPGDYYAEDADITLYAVWGVTFCLFLDANGGVNDSPEQYIDGPAAGTGWYLPEYDIPVREGYTFLGWAESSDAEQAQYGPGDYIWVNSDSILYSVWQKAAAEEASFGHFQETVMDREAALACEEMPAAQPRGGIARIWR